MSDSDDMDIVSKPHASVGQSQDRPTATHTLREARLSDINAIANVWYKAFFDDEIIGQLMHPHRKKYPEDVHYFLLRGVRERFWDWRHQFMVVTATDEKGVEVVVGAADWRRLGEGGRRRELSPSDPSKANPKAR